jgi:hypothetical protein
MSREAHYEVYKVFQAFKSLKVPMTYNKKVNLTILKEQICYFLRKRIEKLFFLRGVTKSMKLSKISLNSIETNVSLKLMKTNTEEE